MVLEQLPAAEQNLQLSKTAGTLAIDLGSTTTVVAFQALAAESITLLSLDPITRGPGQIPSMIWIQGVDDSAPLVGRQVLDAGLEDSAAPQLLRDFKRCIGAPASEAPVETVVGSEEAAQTLLSQIWKRLPADLAITRLVLTAPVEHYRGYREWLLKASASLPVDEVALVDEPTAAALGAGLPPGASLLVVDMGGSTIDLSLVALEGGEGKAAPLAQLLRFRGRGLRDTGQVLRCAKVLGKAGLPLGGRDLDRWIVEALTASATSSSQDAVVPSAAALNAAERLKCRLSAPDVDDQTSLAELISTAEGSPQELRLNRAQLETLLEERGLLDALDDLLEQTLAGGRKHGVQLQDLNAVLAVGGGAQLPLLRRWLSERAGSIPVLSPPPVEAVAVGALSLTPGVRVRDVLQRGVSLRCWDRRSGAHHWHPLFVAGQTWPSEKPFTLVLAASEDNQAFLELVLGEPDNQVRHDVVFVNGLPTLRENSASSEVSRLERADVRLPLTPPGLSGQDCLRLQFRLDEDAQLTVEVEDLRTGDELPRKFLGRIR